MKVDVLKLADTLDRWATQDREANHLPANADVLEQAAGALRELFRLYADEHRQAALMARQAADLRTRVASLQAEATELRSENSALRCVASRPDRPVAQRIKCDSKGNLSRVEFDYGDECRPIGFSG